jgi:hypothetical protein
MEKCQQEKNIKGAQSVHRKVSAGKGCQSEDVKVNILSQNVGSEGSISERSLGSKDQTSMEGAGNSLGTAREQLKEQSKNSLRKVSKQTGQRIG